MRKFDRWVAKLDQKYGRYAIRNLMLYIVLGQGVVLAFTLVVGINVSHFLFFYLPAIRNAQFWRIFSFILIPPQRLALFFTIMAMYFTWLIGSHLESEWGALKFNLFYFLGVFGTILGGLFTGFATNSYIHITLLLAFALLYPDYQILLFFILPVKVKYLGYLAGASLAILFIRSSGAQRVAILISILNLFLFFGPTFIDRIRSWNRRRKWKQNFK